jgi:hypothetical protein
MGKPKLPFAIAMKDDRPFTFAGLGENWKDPESNNSSISSRLESQARGLNSAPTLRRRRSRLQAKAGSRLARISKRSRARSNTGIKPTTFVLNETDENKAMQALLLN